MDSPSQAPIRVLIVDDERAVAAAIARHLALDGFTIVTATDGRKALDAAREFRPDVALVDVHIPELDGFGIARQFDDLNPSVPVVLMTADTRVAYRPGSERGVFDFVRKPIESFAALGRMLANAAKQHRLRKRATDLERRLKAELDFGELVGTSPAMQWVYRFIQDSAPTQTTVLITGESGTGKELVARSIHAHSTRAAKPLVTVNCAAVPEQLVESELFGHAKGAFTGATTDRAGLFRSADGGTLFLDEVGDLPLNVQAHLLRALQQGEIKSVGSDSIDKVDVRVIAATNVDLRQRIEEGLFRSDLFYRLDVLSITLPPLRDRATDIEALAERILARHAMRLGTTPKSLSPGALRTLQRHEWPGNVRELENALERALVLARGTTIEATDLPMTTSEPHAVHELIARSFTPLGIFDLPFNEAKKQWLERFETRYVEQALQRAQGNMTAAARQAGLDRSNFRRIVRKLKDKDDSEPDSE